MKLSQAVQGFLLDRDNSDDLSPKTIALYRNCLDLVIDHLQDPPVENVTKEDLSAFMAWLRKDYQPRRNGTKHLSGSALDNYWKSVRSFFRWAHKELKIERPDLDLPQPDYVYGEVAPFSEEEVKQILAACEYTKEAKTANRKGFRMRRPTSRRDRTMILVMLETGVRIGELHRLRICDVNLIAGEIYIQPFRTGKKSKPRTIPIERTCKTALWHYVTKEREDALEEELIFPVELRSIQSLLMRIEERTGIHVHAHKFRHTFAIQYLRNGGDIFTLQRILGHSSLEMVRHYLDIAKEDVKGAHRRASPVERWRL